MSTTTYISELNGQKLCAERAAYTVEGKNIDESLDDLVSNTSALIAGSNVNITSSASGITVSVPDGSTSSKGALQLAGSIGATVSTENGKAASEKAVRDAIDGIGKTLEIVTTSSSYSDITNLLAAGKLPVLRNATSGSASYSQLTTITSGAIIFSRTLDDNSIYYQRVISSGWQSGLVTLEKAENKVTTIRAASSATDTDYPSEKAVRTTIDSLKLTDLGGTLTVAKGGTGATTAAGAMKALTNDKIGTGTQYFITITENWARSGYCSVADAKTVLGLGSAAYQNTSAFAPSSDSRYYMTNSKDSAIGTSSDYSATSLALNGCTCAMLNNATDNPCGAKKWTHIISMAWAKGVNTSWVSQLAMGTEAGDGMWYRTTSGSVSGLAWKRVMDSSNCSVSKSGESLSVKINGTTQSLDVSGKADLANLSQTILSEPSQVASDKYLVLSQTTFQGSSTSAWANYSLVMMVESRHSGCGLAVIQCNVNTASPSEDSMTGTIHLYTTTSDVRLSSPMLMYRKFNSSTYAWTITVVVNCSDYNNFKIKSILSRNGLLYNTTCTYVTDLTTLGTRIAMATIPSMSGHSHNLTDLRGTLSVAKGGTGATTPAAAMKALTSENIGTSSQYFITITQNWARSGYCSVADAKTVLGLGSAAYKNTDYFAIASHTHKYAASATAGGSATMAEKLNYDTVNSGDFYVPVFDHTNNRLKVISGSQGLIVNKSSDTSWPYIWCKVTHASDADEVNNYSKLNTVGYVRSILYRKSANFDIPLTGLREGDLIIVFCTNSSGSITVTYNGGKSVVGATTVAANRFRIYCYVNSSTGLVASES